MHVVHDERQVARGIGVDRQFADGPLRAVETCNSDSKRVRIGGSGVAFGEADAFAAATRQGLDADDHAHDRRCGDTANDHTVAADSALAGGAADAR